MSYSISFSEVPGLSIQVLSPQRQEKLSAEAMISAKVYKNNKPFTELGRLHWVSAVLKTESGREVMRVALRDNGIEEDNRANDGLWTSPWKLKLPLGKYSLFLVVAEDKKSTRSSEISFSVLPSVVPKEKPVPTKIEVTFPEDLKALPSQVNDLMQGISDVKRVVKEGQVSTKEIIATYIPWLKIITVLMILTAIGTVPILINNIIQAVRKRGNKEVEVVGEKWGSIFAAFKNINKEVSSIEQNLSSTYHIHRQLKDRVGKILPDVVDVYEFARDWSEAPEEYTEPFKAKLWEALKRGGVEEWSPEIGKQAPEGCNKIPATKDYPYPEGTVAEVLSPGFRIKEEGDFLVIKKPDIIVVPYNEKKESKGG